MLSENMTDILMRGSLNRSIGDARLMRDRPDFLRNYLSLAERSRSGTTMPPSPGVKHYTLSGVYNGRELSYTLKYKLREVSLDVLRTMPAEQILHRSRDVACFLRPLQVKEFLRRDERIRTHRKVIDAMRQRCNDAVSAELWDTFVDETLRHMKFSPTYLRTYLKEHATSSSGAGYRWGELQGLDDSSWREVYLNLRGWWEHLSDNRYDNLYLQKAYNIGGRARSNAIPNVQTLLTEQPIHGTKDRDRATMFQPVTSMVGAFLPDKQHWYAVQLHHAERILNVQANIKYPMLDGGQVYIAASDYLTQGLRHEAYDGGSWEAVVGSVLGRHWNPMLTCLGDYDQLPSGGFHTSLCGTLTQLVTVAMTLGGEDNAIILGDDLNVYTRGSVRQKLRPFGELVEYQEMDSQVGFMLGVAYGYDPEMPRLQGFKLTTDRADKSQHLGIDPYGMIYHHAAGAADERQTALWLGMYKGYFGSKPLLASIGKISAEEFRGGSELLHDMAATGYERVDLEEAEGWMD